MNPKKKTEIDPSQGMSSERVLINSTKKEYAKPNKSKEMCTLWRWRFSENYSPKYNQLSMEEKQLNGRESLYLIREEIQDVSDSESYTKGIDEYNVVSTPKQFNAHRNETSIQMFSKTIHNSDFAALLHISSRMNENNSEDKESSDFAHMEKILEGPIYKSIAKDNKIFAESPLHHQDIDLSKASLEDHSKHVRVIDNPYRVIVTKDLSARRGDSLIESNNPEIEESQPVAAESNSSKKWITENEFEEVVEEAIKGT